MREYFIWLLKTLTLVTIFLCVPIIFIGMLAAVGGEAPTKKKNTVAVIELLGEIVDSKEIVESLIRQAKDPEIKGIVLRIDSPGGAVGPSQEIYETVKTLKEKKPIIASMGGVAASGGLYSALGASKIFCQPGTLTGSIGVVMQIPNFTKVTQMVGVNMITLKSGKLKDVGNPFREMTPEEQEYLQSTLSSVHDQFITAVSESRGISKEEVSQFADGRVLIGSRAKELKLVDDFGGVEQAARAVFELKGQPLEKDEQPDLYYPSDRFSQFKAIFKNVSSITKIFGSAPEMKFIVQ